MKKFREALRWIDAGERTPEPFVSVLGYAAENAPMPTVHECYIDHEGMWHSPWCYGVPKVTHWTAMPDAPEEA